MTHPGVPSSPGSPLLDHAAQSAIFAARSRLDALTRQQFPLPVRQLTEEEKKQARESAAQGAVCNFCGAFHAGINTPACPRVATFKLNGDGLIVEGSFWPDAVTESVIEMKPDGTIRSVTFTERKGWNTDRVVFAEAAEEDTEAEEEDRGAA